MLRLEADACDLELDIAFDTQDSRQTNAFGTHVICDGHKDGFQGSESGCQDDCPLYFSYSRDGAVIVSVLPCREVETRRVSFQDAFSHAIHDITLPLSDVQIESVVQTVCGAIHADDDIFGDAQLGQSSVEVTRIEPDIEALFYDASDTFVVNEDIDTIVHDMSAVEFAIAEVERLCSSESQQWEIDCSGADSLVLQSFSDIPLPDADMVMHDSACGSELADMVRLSKIAHVSSAFGSLMYDLLVSRPELVIAVGAFAVGVVSHAVTDTGIDHLGALQVITRYLHEVHVCSSSDAAHVSWLLEHIQVHARLWSEPVGVG